MFLLSLDQQLTLWIYSFFGRSPLFDSVGHVVSEYLIFLMTVATVFFVVFPVGSWRLQVKRRPNGPGKAWIALPVIRVFSSFLPLAVLVVVSQAWKPLISHFFYFRERPEWARLFNTIPYDASFPSSHASGAFALATFVALQQRRVTPLGALFFLGASLVSLGRVFEGLHYVSDILAGALLGCFSAWVIHTGVAWVQRLVQKNKKGGEA